MSVPWIGGRDQTVHVPLSFFPGIQKRDARVNEVGGVARYQSHSMYKGGRRDQSVSKGFRIRDMQCRAANRHTAIDHQDAILKRQTNITLEPGPQDRALPGIPPLGQQDPDLQFLKGNDGDIQGRRLDAIGPFANLSVSLPAPNFPKFGNDIRIQQKHQPRSAGRAGSLEIGASISMSSAPGIASKSAMLLDFLKAFR